MSQPAEKLDFPELQPLALAKGCLETADGDEARARELFVADLEKYPALKSQMVAKLLDTAIHDVIRKAQHQKRQRLFNHAKPDNTSGLVHLAKRNAESLLDTPLSIGKKLGDASLSDLDNEAAMHEAHARNNTAKARWYRFIIEAMGGAECVRDALDNNRLCELRDAAKAE